MNNEGCGRNPAGITKAPIILCPPSGAAYLVSEGRRLACLVRHGQTDWNIERRLQGREHVPLNDKGREQSTECGELFVKARAAGLEVTKIFTSPLGRAEETATSLADALGTGPVCPVELLTERDYGMLSGLTAEERRILHQNKDVKTDCESVKSTASRMRTALLQMMRDECGGAIVAVTHGGIINALFSCITSGRIGTGKNFSENCGVSLVAAGKDAVIPLAYGLTGELFINYIREFSSAIAGIMQGAAK